MVCAPSPRTSPHFSPSRVLISFKPGTSPSARNQQLQPRAPLLLNEPERTGLRRRKPSISASLSMSIEQRPFDFDPCATPILPVSSLARYVGSLIAASVKCLHL